MSIVEKAVEKLNTLPPEDEQSSRPEPLLETMAPRVGLATTVERLQQRARGKQQTVEPPAPTWHVNRLDLKHAGMLPEEDEAAARLSDELRRIKRPLLENALGKGTQSWPHAQRIMVTSAVPNEGKTFMALNLALSLAREPDFEVLLVDGDIPKSDISRLLKLEGRPGLMDLLVEEQRALSDVVISTDIPNLSVLPVGQRQALTTELVGSRRMEQVLQELDGPIPRRLVIFDSSPLLATTESQVLASHMGQIVMVVAAGRTQELELDSALQRLRDTQYVGMILNMSRLPASESHYYNYYHHYSKDR